jgi:predicted MFS family arabinose efflux permease
VIPVVREASGLDEAARDRARRRTRWTLSAGVALGSTGHIAAVTVATIVAQDMLGSPTLAGAPSSTVVLGAAAGALLLSSVMARRGRRIGLAGGYAIGVFGALIAALAVLTRSFPLLLGGTFLIGFGNSSNLLSRYAAADLVPIARRASAIGFVVWGSTVGSVVGPWLVPISSELAKGVGLPSLVGPYLVPVLFVGAAAVLSFALLRPDPTALADESAIHHKTAAAAASLRELFDRPSVLAAIVALVIGQFTMVLIMTMTPLHMTSHGHGLAAVGLLLSAHTAGMYALAPVSGRLTERFGSVQTIFLGTAALIASGVLAAIAPPDGGTILFAALFLLGFGWNLGFVAGSAMLSSGLAFADRTRLQGFADALIWSTSAVASLGSGVIVATAGYTGLSLLGAGLVAIPIIVLISQRGALTGAGVSGASASVGQQLALEPGGEGPRAIDDLL